MTASGIDCSKHCIDSDESQAPLDCTWFAQFPMMCDKGQYKNFNPKANCCACGGGNIQTQAHAEDVTLTSGLLCRNSDYRTLASDPFYEVIEVNADIDEKGYHMLMMVKVKPKNNPSAP